MVLGPRAGILLRILKIGSISFGNCWCRLGLQFLGIVGARWVRPGEAGCGRVWATEMLGTGLTPPGLNVVEPC